MSIQSLFEWVERSALGVSINESLYAFAVIESVHLIALAVIGGAAAAIFTFTVRQRVAMKEEAPAVSAFGKLTAVASLVLWSGVGVMGRAIGFI